MGTDEAFKLFKKFLLFVINRVDIDVSAHLFESHVELHGLVQDLLLVGKRIAVVHVEQIEQKVVP